MPSLLVFSQLKTVKKHIGALVFLLFIQLTACSPYSGSGNGSGEGLLCNNTQNLTEVQNFEKNFDSDKPQINIDPKFDDYIVQFEDETPETLEPSGQADKEYEVVGLNLKAIRNNTFTLKISGELNFKKEMIHRLNNQRRIKFIEPDYSVELIPHNAEEDLEIAATTSAQWHHQAVQTPSAWQITTGSQEIVVAVVDSGIDYTHTDLKNNMWVNSKEIRNGRDDDGNGYIDDIYGWNFHNNNSNPITTSSSNHGTHVAGIIGATGSSSRGVYGEARKVKLMALKFIGDTGSGRTSNAIRAIDYAISKKVFAINNSWGSINKSLALDAAVKRAERAGILFLVAAGNGNNGTGFDISQKGYYPAAFTQSNIIRVAATKTNNALTNFSNFSKRLVDVAAPGSNILSTISHNRYMKMSGTSMATPLVTGIAVLIKAANPGLGFAQIKAILSMTVDPIDSLKNKIISGGRVNARKAVAMAANVSADFSGCYQ